MKRNLKSLGDKQCQSIADKKEPGESVSWQEFSRKPDILPDAAANLVVDRIRRTLFALVYQNYISSVKSLKDWTFTVRCPKQLGILTIGFQWLSTDATERTGYVSSGSQICSRCLHLYYERKIAENPVFLRRLKTRDGIVGPIEAVRDYGYEHIRVTKPSGRCFPALKSIEQDLGEYVGVEERRYREKSRQIAVLVEMEEY